MGQSLHPSEGLGRMNLGNAIFSKYPITETLRISQSDRTDLDALTETFYIRRAIGQANIDLGGVQLAAFVVHTEAYDEDGTKKRQIAHIHDVLKSVSGPFVIGGDHELPRQPSNLKAFPDERTEPLCSDEFDQPPYTPEVMRPFYDDHPRISLSNTGRMPAAKVAISLHSVMGPDEVNESGKTPGC